MNKIITTSLLLLAGTALSQAATVTVDLFSNVYNNTNSSSNITHSAVFMNNNSSSESDFAASNIQSWIANSGYDVTTYFLWTTRKGGTQSGGSSLTSSIVMASTETANTYSVSFYHRKNFSGSVSACGYTLSDADLSSTVSLSFTYTATTNENSTPIEIAFVYQTSDGWQMSSATTTTDMATISLDGVSLTDSTIYLVISSKDYEKQYAAATITGTVCATATYTAIPEPSAFGLLAGIGALALVVSRRRRRA